METVLKVDEEQVGILDLHFQVEQRQSPEPRVKGQGGASVPPSVWGAVIIRQT